jgi:hypothetical protein
MKYLKKYTTYKESIMVDLMFQNMVELLESLTIWHDALLSSIIAEELDIYDTFQLPVEEYEDKLDLNILNDHTKFINSLSSLALRKSVLQHSDDYSTFINKPCKFMFIYDINKNDLENPKYLLFQSWIKAKDKDELNKEDLGKWDDVKLYKVNDNVDKFYNKLSSRTIELIDGDENYIYNVSNGNEWVLQNVAKENDVYKKVFRKEELQDFLSGRNIKVNVL